MTAGSLKRKGALLLLTVGLGAVAWYFGGRAWDGYRCTILAGEWEATKAVVTSASREDVHADQPTEARDRESITVIAAYKYTVDGTDYVGEIREEGLSADKATSQLARFAPTGQKAREITVFRNPSDPAETVLDREFRMRTIFDTGVAFFAGVGALGLLHTLIERSGNDGKPTGDSSKKDV